MRHTHTTRQLVEAAMLLQDMVAPSVANASHHLRQELVITDGYSAGEPETVVRASAESSSTERAAVARMELNDMHDLMQLHVVNVLLAIRELHSVSQRAARLRAPRVVTKPDNKDGLCCASQTGKHAVVEWGDALCLRHGVKAGLCEKHYKAWLRARHRDGVDVSKDFEPA
jgi:hypothetical protein